MPQLLRALLVTAAATGVYALLLSAVRPSSPAPRTVEIEADELSAEEQRMLISELDAQL